MSKIINKFSEIPGALIAAVGFGTSLVIKEAFVLSSSSDVPPANQALSFFLPLAFVLLIVAVVYFKKPELRLSRYPGFAVMVAIVTALASLLLSGELLEGNEQTIVFVRILFQIGSNFLLLFWIETVIPFGAKRSSLLFSAACICAGAVTILLAITALDFEKGVVAFLPIFSITCLYFFKEHNASRRGFVSSSFSGAASDQSFSLVKHKSNRQRIVFIVACLIPFFCYRYAFGEAAYTWIYLFGSSAVVPLSQFANALGMIVAGLFVFGFASFFWKSQNYVLINLAVLVALLFSMYLASSSADEGVFGYLLMISFGQKLIIYLAMLAPFTLWRSGNYSSMSIAAFALFFSTAGITTYSGASSSLPSYLQTSLTIGMLILATFCIILLLYLGQKDDTSKEEKEIEGRALETYANDLGREALDAFSEFYHLTNREKDILALLVDRYTTNDIAEMLVLSVHTVKTHMKNIYAKLGVHSQKDLILLIESFCGIDS